MAEETKNNASPKKAFQRRTLFIKKTMQLNFMLLMVTSVFLGISIMFFEFVSTMHEVFSQHPMLLQPLYESFTGVGISLLIKIVVYVIFIAMLSAILSHKFAGPIYNFEKTCREIAKGDFTKRIRLRKGDGFSDFQRDFNAMMDTVEAEIKKPKEENGTNTPHANSGAKEFVLYKVFKKEKQDGPKDFILKDTKIYMKENEWASLILERIEKIETLDEKHINENLGEKTLRDTKENRGGDE